LMVSTTVLITTLATSLAAIPSLITQSPVTLLAAESRVGREAL
jgi:hypothetical protein